MSELVVLSNENQKITYVTGEVSEIAVQEVSETLKEKLEAQARIESGLSYKERLTAADNAYAEKLTAIDKKYLEKSKTTWNLYKNKLQEARNKRDSIVAKAEAEWKESQKAIEIERETTIFDTVDAKQLELKQAKQDWESEVQKIENWKKESEEIYRSVETLTIISDAIEKAKAEAKTTKVVTQPNLQPRKPIPMKKPRVRF